MVNEFTSHDECGKTKTIKAIKKLNVNYMREIKGYPIFTESGSVCLPVPDAST